ncbi:MAG: SusC/RagA family TonB-linked outer membrane protein, partial [Spirochaetota bacterium]
MSDTPVSSPAPADAVASSASTEPGSIPALDPGILPETTIPAMDPSLRDSFSVRLSSQAGDGSIDVKVADDWMSATATFMPPRDDGRPLSRDTVVEMLHRFGVTSCLLMDVIDNSVMECNLDRHFIRDRIVAEGVIPEEIVPEHVDLEERFVPRERMASSETIKVDFRKLASQPIVKKGEVLGHLVPASAGRVGLNTPLIILDGFESTLQKLIDINENEVESITVLKDASATAIYGSRGANGVVVVQTKAPTAGKLRITYRGDVNVEAPDLTAYSLLNARDKLDLEQKVGLYNYARAETDVPLKRYYNWVLNEVNSGVNTDWMAIPLRMGVGQRHNFRLEGGDQTFRYSASVQNNNIQGVMKGSFRNTFNGTINLTYMLKGIKFTNQLNIGIGNNQNSPYGASSVYNLLGGFSDYVKLNPYWRPYDANGNVNKYLGDPGNYDYTSRWNSLPTNPLYNATLNGFDKTKTSSIVNNFAIEWTVVKDLVLRSRIGFTLNMDQNDIFRSADNTAFANYTIDNVFRKGDYYYDVVNGFNYDGSLSLTYSKVLAEKHSIFFGFDYNMRQTKSSEYSFRAEGFSNSNFDFPSMALQYAQGERPGGKESLVRAVGFTGNVNYTYDNRYYIDASFREDGSSQFGAKKRFAPFWSTGIGWNLHSEKFMKDQTIVNRLKIRGSLGITGTQNFDAYQALSTYQYYTGDRYYNWMGAYMMGLGNDNLRWQQKMNYDIGLEAQLLKNRIAFTFDYYIGTTKDLVSSINLPPSNGFSSYVENIGTMKNTGFESKLTLFPYRDLQKGIAWSVTGVVFRNSNKIIDISQALIDAQAVINKTGGSNPNIQYQVGYSTNTIWVV